MSVRAPNHFVTEFFAAVKATYYTDYNKVREVLDAATIIRDNVIRDIDAGLLDEDCYGRQIYDEHATNLINEHLRNEKLHGRTDESDYYAYTLRQAEIHPVYTDALNGYTHEYLEEHPLEERYESMLFSLMFACEDSFSPTFEPKFLHGRVHDYARKAFYRDNTPAVRPRKVKFVIRKAAVRKTAAEHNDAVMTQPLVDALAGVAPCNPPCGHCKSL